MTIRAIFSIFLIFQFSFVNAAPVLTAPPSTSQSEFESALLAFKSAQSPIDYYLEQHPDLSATEELTTRFAHAEESLLQESDLHLVRKNYLHLLELENQADWREEHRRLFLISYLRLLQISQNHLEVSEQAEWMSKAIFYLTHIEPPRELIPPPVFINLNRFQESLSSQTLELSGPQKENFQRVAVLGRVYSTKEAIKIPVFKNPVRLTFLSHFYEPQTILEKGSHIKDTVISQISFTNENCDSLKITSSFLNALETKVYKPMHCEQKDQPEKIAKNETQKNPAQISKEIYLPLNSETTKLEWKMEKRHWVWIGAGALATAIVITQLNQGKGKSSSSPSETYGF